MTNKTTKELGAHSPSGRHISCLVTQSGESALTFGGSNEEALRIPIDSLAAGGEQTVELHVKVPRKAISYRKTNVQISLVFTPPDKSQPTPIQVYDLPIQVSNSYHYDRDADVLLVTNYETAAEEVGLWNHLICGHLGRKMDVWNVSVNGHLELLGGPRNTERQSLFDLYKGKTIVMLGNSFRYFDRGNRTTMDLIDSRDLMPSTLGGMSILISGVDVDKSQPHPISRFLCATSFPNTRVYTTIQQLVTGLTLERQDKSFYSTQYVCTPAVKGDNSQRCAIKAARAASELLRQLPHLRFLITWSPAEALGRNASGAGRIEVRPCVPYDHSRFIITRPVPDNRIGEMNELAVLLAFPFTTKLQMLWDLFGDEGPIRKKDSIQGLSEVVEAEMVAEFARLVNSMPPWPDTIQKPEILSYLPRISQFLEYDTTRAFAEPSIDRVVEIVGNLRLLADCCPGSAPRQLTFATRRKNVWTEVAQKLDAFMRQHYISDDKKSKNTPYLQYIRYVNEQTAKTVTQPHASRKQHISQRAIAKLPQVNVGADFGEATTGIVDIELLGNIVLSHSEAVVFKDRNSSHGARLEEDLTHAKSQVEHDMARLPGYSA